MTDLHKIAFLLLTFPRKGQNTQLRNSERKKTGGKKKLGKLGKV